MHSDPIGGPGLRLDDPFKASSDQKRSPQTGVPSRSTCHPSQKMQRASSEFCSCYDTIARSSQLWTWVKKCNGLLKPRRGDAQNKNHANQSHSYGLTLRSIASACREHSGHDKMNFAR